MPQFEVTVYRTVYEYATVPVEAEDADAAERKVQEMIDDQQTGNFDWDTLSVDNKSIETDGADEVKA